MITNAIYKGIFIEITIKRIIIQENMESNSLK